MNQKIFAFLIVVIAICSTTSVFAVDLNDTHDFNGSFNMNVASDDNFTQVNSPILKSVNFYKNTNGTIFVLVYNNDIKTTVNVISNGNLSIINSAVDNDTGVINEGDLFIFNATENMTKDIGEYNFTSFVVKGDEQDPPTTVAVCGNDINLLKEYANTIKFN